MTRVRLDLFLSLDGYAATAEPTPDSPMGKDWERLTAAYAATRTFRELVFGDTSGAGTTGIDDRYARASFEGIGSEIMGAAMFGLHSFPDDPAWKGWWGDRPPFHTPVYVLTHTAPRPSIPMEGERRSTSATPPAKRCSPRRAMPPAATTCASVAGSAPRVTSCSPGWSISCT